VGIVGTVVIEGDGSFFARTRCGGLGCRLWSPQPSNPKLSRSSRGNPEIESNRRGCEMYRVVRVMRTRTAGTARILHLILEVLLRLSVALGDASEETSCVGWSDDDTSLGRGEGGGVNIWWKERGA